MPAPPPIAQIRVIAPTADADALLVRLTAHARALYGPHVVYRAQTRTARREGHVRAYLTVSRKEEPH